MASFFSAVVVVAASTVASAQEAVPGESPGLMRMTDRQPNGVQQAQYRTVSSAGADDCCGCADADCGPQESDPGNDCCNVVDCCPPSECSKVVCSDKGCRTEDGCGCGCCRTKNAGIFSRLFGGRRGRCSCNHCENCGKGTGNTLFDKLFGCKSGNGCDSCPPLAGNYQITYAQDPAFADSRDGRAWAAQGYGIPVTVPTAPIVRYSYNYGHGTPSSRLTPISTYNPVTCPQALFHQSWH